MFTGRLEHEELAELLPACEALVVPSTFPEAFGMVAAEAAACGVLPLSAAHSGLAEVSEVLAQAVPAGCARACPLRWTTMRCGRSQSASAAWLELAPGAARGGARGAGRRRWRERWSWDRVARGVIAAAEGELDGLRRP